MFEAPVVEVFEADGLRTVSSAPEDGYPVCPDATTVAAVCQVTGQSAIMCAAGAPYIILCNGGALYCASTSAG